MKNKKELQIFILYVLLTVLSICSVFNNYRNYRTIQQIRQEEIYLSQTLERSLETLEQAVKHLHDRR